jgi:hypothetical protein
VKKNEKIILKIWVCNAYLKEGAGVPPNLIWTNTIVKVLKTSTAILIASKHNCCHQPSNGNHRLTAYRGYQD